MYTVSVTYIICISLNKIHKCYAFNFTGIIQNSFVSIETVACLTKCEWRNLWLYIFLELTRLSFFHTTLNWIFHSKMAQQKLNSNVFIKTTLSTLLMFASQFGVEPFFTTDSLGLSMDHLPLVWLSTSRFIFLNHNWCFKLTWWRRRFYQRLAFILVLSTLPKSYNFPSQISLLWKSL